MKICIVGLGAVGGTLAARLALGLPAGTVDLCALARGATLAAVQKHGLRVRTLGVDQQAGKQTVEPSIPLRASDDTAALGPQDLVVVAVKATALASVAPALARLCGPQTQVLTAMNGVPWWFFDGLPGPCAGMTLQSADPGGQLSRLLPARQVLGGVVHFSSASPAPGVVQPVGGKGLILGRATGGLDAGLQTVVDLFKTAGMDATASAQIQRDVWFKLWGNMTMNPVSALTGAPCDHILDDALVRGFMSAVMLEAQAIGRAIGIPIEQVPEERHAVTRKLGSFRTSMLQDTEAGRPLELDALIGTVREIGQHLGVATPFMDGLLGLTRLMAREKGLYPAAA